MTSEPVVARTEWKFNKKAFSTPRFLKQLGIPFRQSDSDKSFWADNEILLPALFASLQAKANEVIHRLHPDKGGDGRQFDVFLQNYRAVKKLFRFHLAIAPPESEIIFTSAAQLAKNKIAAKARSYRKRHRKTYLATRRRNYARLKAAGQLPKQDAAKGKRYARRHKRKTNNASRKYRARNPDKVRQWRENYKQSLRRRGLRVGLVPANSS